MTGAYVDMRIEISRRAQPFHVKVACSLCKGVWPKPEKPALLVLKKSLRDCALCDVIEELRLTKYEKLQLGLSLLTKGGQTLSPGLQVTKVMALCSFVCPYSLLWFAHAAGAEAKFVFHGRTVSLGELV